MIIIMATNIKINDDNNDEPTLMSDREDQDQEDYVRDDDDDYFDDGEDGDDDDFTNYTIIFRYDLTENDDFDREEIATYEEVPRLFFKKQ